jgi:dUTP pyrophosphatase
MKVQIQKLRIGAVLPQYARDGDAGLDLTATHVIKEDDKQVTYGTGLAIAIPHGFVGLMFPRSSVRNTQLSLSNCVGVIDSGYRGELQATFNKLHGQGSTSYEIGNRIVQLVIVAYPTIELEEVKELDQTERGTRGFGSTN